MVETEIRTPDPAEQPHAYMPLERKDGAPDGRCGVCYHGSGHHIHDVPLAEPGACVCPSRGRRYFKCPVHGKQARADADARFDRDVMAPVRMYAEQAETRAPDPEDTPDMINHPPHYTAHPSGVEVIEITEHLGFCLGNVVKYVLRADHKGDALADLEKAAWYLAREIQRRKAE